MQKNKPGCLGIILIVVIVAAAWSLISEWKPASNPVQSESSAKQYCETVIGKKVFDVLGQRGNVQVQHLGVGSLGNEYKVTSIANVEGIVSGNRQSKWTCRIQWNDASSQWDQLEIYPR